MIARTVLCFVCLLASFSAWAGELSLARAVELAVENAPAIQAAEAGRDAAKEDLIIGRAALLPHLDLTGSYQYQTSKTRYDRSQNIFQPNLKYRDSTVALRMVQPLFDLERWAGYRQGEVSAEAGEMRLRLERQRLILETVQTYLEVVTAQSALRAARAKEEAAERLALQAEAVFEAGVSAFNERLDADSRRDLARAERLLAENNLDQATERLDSLTGVMAAKVSPPAIFSELSASLPEQSEVWELRAAEEALSVRLARLQFRTAEEEETKAWGSGMPKVEGFASIQGNRATSGQLGTGTRARDEAVGVQVTLPLFSGGGDWAQLRKSKKAALQTAFALQDDIRLARLTARQAFLGYSASILQLHAMQKAIVSVKEAADAARMGHEVGLRTMTEVLDADERRFEAEKNLAEAEAQLVFAELQLKSSVGVLDTEPLPEVFGAGLKSP
ncbi:MAG: TolC family protein [Mariprofundaceae bacterium]|nr:TolC family protein [Mariprofundaceae bacterium]